MLLRTEKLVSKFLSKQIFLRNNFCHSKPDISMLELQKQKADLSLEIYHLILRKPDGLDLEKKSLHDMIMEKIYQKSQNRDQNISQQQGDLSTKNSDGETFKYHEEARKPFIDLFEKGYEIDSYIFSQKRIQKGKIESNQQQKFIFHPTYLITNQVFKQLHMLQRNIKIMTGHYGISKTVSVCLFWHLAKFIDEYRFQEGVTISKDMMRVPKLVYLTLSTDQDDVKKIILNQCPEVLKKLNLTDETQYNWRHLRLKEFYRTYFPKTIFNLVIDQFNFVAQLGRIYQKEIENDFKEHKQSEIQNIKNKKVKLFFELKEKIEFCIHQFHGVIGLSSMDLEKKLFKQITFATQTNSLIPQFQWIRYSTEFYQYQSLLQIADYFIFEMNQRIFKNLKNTNVSQENQKEMKKQCFDELINRFNKKQYFFFTPLDIRQGIQDQIKLKKNIQSFDKPIQQLKNEVKTLFQDFVKKSHQKYKQLLTKHFEKQGDKNDNIKRIKLMFSIYNYLEQNVGKKTQQQNITQVSRIPTKIIRFTPQEIDKFLDKKLFQYRIFDDNIELMVPSRFILILIQPCVYKQFNLYAQYKLQQIKDTKNRSQKGQSFESIFLKALNKGNVKFRFNLKNMVIQDGINQYEFDIKNEIYTFVQLQKRKKSSDPISILDRFHKTINKMRENQQKYAVVFPVSKDHKSNQTLQKFMIENRANYSKCIDFALIKNDLENNLITIWIIDLTVSKSEIRTKIQRFIRQFLEFKDKHITKLPDIKNKPNVEINYAVFGPENGIYHNNFKKVLQKQFGKQITFKTLKKSNVFTVGKLVNQKSCLLKRVVYIDLGSDFQFDKQSNKNNEYLPLLADMYKQVQKKKQT